MALISMLLRGCDRYNIQLSSPFSDTVKSLDTNARLVLGPQVLLQHPEELFDLMVRVIGIDCATDPKRVGYAFARFSGGHTIVEEVALGSATQSPTAAIADWLDEGDAPALLALDRPAWLARCTC